MKEYRDHYFLKAKRENYPARSIYKLRELDARFRLLAPGMRVLDLGAAPGSWSLGAAERVGKRGRVLACDIQETATAFPPQVVFMVSNAFEPTEAFAAAMAETGPFDLVMSDMAPSTTGTRFTDQARSLELAQTAFETALKHLKPGGNFVVKIFMGPDVGELLAPMRRAFRKVTTFKPKSSRAESKETFFTGLGFKGAAPAGDAAETAEAPPSDNAG
ncbi:MAG: RlmE family RNA methyltransferase [Desulfovibrio sp.]|uniref:RlmE family RNA methyltransferase n=1 Tax=Desulfovibrio sp. TaxID=885 RepID=UPI001A73685E|nr:RlmE family RNA methyltransferase [Desulfovibrio sp.]MBD5416875.1 RlmE family RNA methyltransferase [Desulfovibrio sp.]